MTTPIIEINDIGICFNGKQIQHHLNLTVQRGEVLAIVGGSGSGKTTLLREMLMLVKPMVGSIRIFGQEMMTANPEALLAVQRRFGVLFQQNALFSSLTVHENVSFPLKEHTILDLATINELAMLKIQLAGLPTEAALKYPAELSGGMQKRAALARAIVLDPELIFLDEPTAGLDPYTAGGFDELVLNLQSTMGLTIVMVTHDVDSLWAVSSRVAFLGEGKVLSVATISELITNPHPLIQSFFSGPRGRAVAQYYMHNDTHRKRDNHGD